MEKRIHKNELQKQLNEQNKKKTNYKTGETFYNVNYVRHDMNKHKIAGRLIPITGLPVDVIGIRQENVDRNRPGEEIESEYKTMCENSGKVWVRGYGKKDGTWVFGYCQKKKRSS